MSDYGIIFFKNRVTIPIYLYSNLYINYILILFFHCSFGTQTNQKRKEGKRKENMPHSPDFYTKKVRIFKFFYPYTYMYLVPFLTLLKFPNKLAEYGIDKKLARPNR